MTSSRARVLRYVAMGGVMDLTIYVALSLAPVLAERWGAEKLALGMLAACWGVSYTLNAVLGGRISDRMSRTSLMRVGLLLIILVCVLFSRATRVWQLYLGLPFVALGMGCFWPSLQAAIADESGPEDLTRHLGWFNVSWGLGKGFGVLAGGHIAEALGRRGFLVAAAVGLVLFVLLPRVPRGGGLGRALIRDGEERPPEVREGFRGAALVANFAAFGLATSILSHYPEWNAKLGRTGGDYGNVVGGIFLAQTVAFVILLRWRGWHYRVWPQILAQIGAAGGAVLLATGLPVPLLLPFLALVGFGFGSCYYAAIYYSLHSDTARGGRAGLHEAIIGTGHFVVPLLGGLFAWWSDSARAPYLVAAGVVALAVLVQGALFVRMRLH